VGCSIHRLSQPTPVCAPSADPLHTRHSTLTQLMATSPFTCCVGSSPGRHRDRLQRAPPSRDVKTLPRWFWMPLLQHPTVQGSPCLAVHDHVACCPRRHGAPTLGSCRAVACRQGRGRGPRSDDMKLVGPHRLNGRAGQGRAGQGRIDRRGLPRTGQDRTGQDRNAPSRVDVSGRAGYGVVPRVDAILYCLGTYSYTMITSAAASWQTEATRNALAETRQAARAGTDRRHELAHITCSRASPEKRPM
jgi:hypothetical protein